MLIFFVMIAYIENVITWDNFGSVQ